MVAQLLRTGRNACVVTGRLRVSTQESAIKRHRAAIRLFMHVSSPCGWWFCRSLPQVKFNPFIAQPEFMEDLMSIMKHVCSLHTL